MKDLNSTKIPQLYSNGLFRNIGYNLPADHTDKILTTMVKGITSTLAHIKSKANPVAFVINDKSNEFILAAIVEYFENEDDKTKPGNWGYTWTFDEDDIPENTQKISIYDAAYSNFFYNVARKDFNMGFHKYEYLGDMVQYLSTVIKQWLIDNAGSTDENGEPVDGVKLDGIIQFRVAVENDKPVLSAEPDGEIKQMVKDDAAIEK